MKCDVCDGQKAYLKNYRHENAPSSCRKPIRICAFCMKWFEDHGFKITQYDYYYAPPVMENERSLHWRKRTFATK